MPSGLLYLRSFDRSISSFFLIPCFKETPVLNANSVDPDQSPRSVACDLGLYYLQMSLLWDARHK